MLRVAPPEEDPHAGLRSALRRRLTRATPEERVAGALVHLAGYPPGLVAGVLGRSEHDTVALAGVLAPPPGIVYRDLGDPELTQAPSGTGPARPGRFARRPRWSTIVAIVLVITAVVLATQMTGPRPTLGPPVEEGGAATFAPPAPPTGGDLSGTADRSPS
jgi:hypothetical protein